MPATTTRLAYLETGLSILADLGYGGLKLAEVCRRLGVTSGSFYHFFANWGTYTTELIAHWESESNTALIRHVRAQTDPRRRIDILRGIALSLPYHAEAAIRTWSSLDRRYGRSSNGSTRRGMRSSSSRRRPSWATVGVRSSLPSGRCTCSPATSRSHARRSRALAWLFTQAEGFLVGRTGNP